MKTKFATFEIALAALCRQHHVAVAPTEDGQIGIWDVGEGDAPIDGLLDCTSAAPESPAADLPPYFLTALAAGAHPGYLGHTVTMAQAQAQALADARPGTTLVPIGPPKHVRGWAVIKHLL